MSTWQLHLSQSKDGLDTLAVQREGVPGVRYGHLGLPQAEVTQRHVEIQLDQKTLPFGFLRIALESPVFKQSYSLRQTSNM